MGRFDTQARRGKGCHHQRDRYMRLGKRQIPVYLMLLLILGCGQDETIVHNGDTDPPEYTVDIDPGPFSMTLTIHESEPTAHRKLTVKGDNRLWEMGFKPGASIVIKGLNPDVQYDIEISGEDMLCWRMARRQS